MSNGASSVFKKSSSIISIPSSSEEFEKARVYKNFFNFNTYLYQILKTDHINNYIQ